MCDWLMAQVPESVESLLDIIELESSAIHDQDIFKGPFGLVSLADSSTNTNLSSNFSDEINITLKSPSVSMFQLDDSESPFLWDDAAVSDLVSSLHAYPGDPIDSVHYPCLESLTPIAAAPTLERTISPISTNLPIINNTSMSHRVLEDGHFLLLHYGSKVVDSLAPFSSSKPPWKALHLPCALQALAELTVMGQTNNAKASLMYALMAISAFNLDKFCTEHESTPRRWWNTGQTYQQRAKYYLKRCLQEISQGGTKKAKYKEVLMALMSMVTISVSALPPIPRYITCSN